MKSFVLVIIIINVVYMWIPYDRATEMGNVPSCMYIMCFQRQE